MHRRHALNHRKLQLDFQEEVDLVHTHKLGTNSGNFHSLRNTLNEWYISRCAELLAFRLAFFGSQTSVRISLRLGLDCYGDTCQRSGKTVDWHLPGHRLVEVCIRDLPPIAATSSFLSRCPPR